MSYRQTKGFRWFLAQLDEAPRRQAEAMLATLTAQVSGTPPGPERARAIHARIDALQADFFARRPDLLPRVSCHRGCGACCSMWVGVTQEEADLLAGLVQSGAVPIDRERLALQAAQPDPAAYFALGSEAGRCVFLDEAGACRVHADRPTVCRLILVASDPRFCAEADTDTRIEAIIAPDAELLASAVLSADADPGPTAGRSLAQGLLRALRA